MTVAAQMYQNLPTREIKLDESISSNKSSKEYLMSSRVIDGNTNRVPFQPNLSHYQNFAN